MTERLYYDNATVRASVSVCETKVHEGRVLVRTAATPCHPQGGGQPSDRGWLAGLPLLHAENDPHDRSDVWHHVPGGESISAGDCVDIVVDAELRQLHARWHSAAHLIAEAALRVSPQLRAISGHQWPGQGRVEFVGAALEPQALAAALPAAVAEMVAAALPFAWGLTGPTARWVRIGEGLTIPCGGTHVSTTAELNTLAIRKVSRRDDRLAVSYVV